MNVKQTIINGLATGKIGKKLGEKLLRMLKAYPRNKLNEKLSSLSPDVQRLFSKMLKEEADLQEREQLCEKVDEIMSAL